MNWEHHTIRIVLADGQYEIQVWQGNRLAFEAHQRDGLNFPMSNPAQCKSYRLEIEDIRTLGPSAKFPIGDYWRQHEPDWDE